MPHPPKPNRLHAYLLGPPSRAVTPERDTLRSVLLLSSARDTLVRMLGPPAPIRAGLLFGKFAGDQLVVHHAVPGGHRSPPTYLPPFQFEPDYALGWADALAELNPSLEWVGMWVARPERILTDDEIDIFWASQAAEVGLLDPDSTLLIANWSEGELELQGWTVLDGDLAGLPVHCPETEKILNH